MNRKRFLSFVKSRRGEYVGPCCELRLLAGNEWVCTSRLVTVDDYVVNENEMDW